MIHDGLLCCAIARTSSNAFIIVKGTLSNDEDRPRNPLRLCNGVNENPCLGKYLDSILSGLPVNSTRKLGMSFTNSSTIAIAGNKSPPVPPAAIKMLDCFMECSLFMIFSQANLSMLDRNLYNGICIRFQSFFEVIHVGHQLQSLILLQEEYSMQYQEHEARMVCVG